MIRSVRPFSRALVAGLLVVGVMCGLVGWADPLAAQEPTDGDDASRTLSGTLRFEREPVVGVTIEVAGTSDAGTEVTASVETGDDGKWSVTVPPGTYTVVLVEDTLPEGVGLRDADRAEQEVVVEERFDKTAIFPLGDREDTSRSTAERAVDLTFKGLRTGLIIAMAAVGLSLIFGVTGLVNFAHGELVTFGALVAWYLNEWGSGPELHFVIAAALAVLVGGGFGWLQDAGLWRPLRRRRTGLIALIVVSIGFSFVLRHIFLIVFGAQGRPYGNYTGQRNIDLGPINLSPRDWWIIAISLVVLVAMGMLLARTRLGTAMRAVSDNPDLAAASGVDVERVIRATWVIGGALAALGGVMLGLSDQTVTEDMGFRQILFIFSAVVVGGLGSGYGAMVGGILIGVTIQLSTLVVDLELRPAVALTALIVVLLFRPQGLLGQAERVG